MDVLCSFGGHHVQDKFLITHKSENQKTGPIMLTTSPRVSCPSSCPLKKGAADPRAGTCYAEHGALGGFLWMKLDTTPIGGYFKQGQIKVFSFDELLAAIRGLPEGALWRHNQAGDLSSDDAVTVSRTKLRQLTAANRGRRGFTFTHFDVLTNEENRSAIAEANAGGFRVNLSANSLKHADELYDTGVGPVATILPPDCLTNTKTPKGRTVVVCPAQTHYGVTCSSCGLCSRMRPSIVGFAAHNRDKYKITDPHAPPSQTRPFVRKLRIRDSRRRNPMAHSVLQQLKELDKQRDQLLADAKKEALQKAQEAVAELNALGFSYRLELNGGSTSGGGSRSRKGTRKLDPNRPCPICNFRTKPPHDGRTHTAKRQPGGKAPFTEKELAAHGFKKVA